MTHHCLRCQSTDILIPSGTHGELHACNQCHSIAQYHPSKELNWFRFYFKDYTIEIHQAHSYINDIKIDYALPYDVSEKRIKNLLIFS